MSTKPLDIDALVNELLPELLPDIVNAISVLIGYRSALKLIQAIGGIDLVVPTGELRSGTAVLLINAVGDDDALTLMKAYGGERLYIPRCHAAMTQLRNQEFCKHIAMMVANGDTQTAAIHLYAPQYGFTERWAYVVLRAESRRTDTQLSLFD